MATAAQIAANRRNATKSTGPRTVQGKDRARMNALVHGLTACILERPEEVERRVLLREQLLSEWKPGSVLEAAILDQMADVILELERIPEVRAAALLMIRRRKEVPDHITDNQLLALDLGTGHSRIGPIQNYQGKLSRQLSRLTRDLRQLQQDRAMVDGEAMSSVECGMSNGKAEADRLSPRRGRDEVPPGASDEIVETKPMLGFANGEAGIHDAPIEIEKTNPIQREAVQAQAVGRSADEMKLEIVETKPIGVEGMVEQGVGSTGARVGWPMVEQIDLPGRRVIGWRVRGSAAPVSLIA